MADYVRVEFESGRTKKLIPKAKHVMQVCEFASKRLGRQVTVTELSQDWGSGWPYLIMMLRREEEPDLSLDDACNLMDAYFETHAKDPKALENLARQLGRALERYTALEQKAKKEDADRPTEAPANT